MTAKSEPSKCSPGLTISHRNIGKVTSKFKFRAQRFYTLSTKLSGRDKYIESTGMCFENGVPSQTPQNAASDRDC